MITFIFFIFSIQFLFGLEPREKPIHLKTSVIVPCHKNHIPYLSDLLKTLSEQTCLPDEIVIALTKSQITSVPEIPKELPFHVELVLLERQFPSHARNAACEKCSGDLIICQDADDIPHPQRIEIIKHLFEQYHLDFLIHRWIPSSEQFSPYEINHSITKTYDIHSYSPDFEICSSHHTFDRVHSGNPAFLKKIFNKVKWPERYTGEDVHFNTQVFRFFPKKVILDENLVMYRVELSSFKNRYSRPSQYH